MKKLLSILALFVFMASSVLATTVVTITPGIVNMAPTDDADVSVCISDGVGNPAVGLDVTLGDYCKDVNLNGFCGGGGDLFFPVAFTPTVTSTPTNGAGCGTVHLHTSGASGQYAYVVNGQDTGHVVASGTGLALVPEFTTLGAGLVLAGAGAYMYRRRNKK